MQCTLGMLGWAVFASFGLAGGTAFVAAFANIAAMMAEG